MLRHIATLGRSRGNITDAGVIHHAGWKEYVEPHQEAAQFWFSIWKSAGKPLEQCSSWFNEENPQPIPLSDKNM